MTRPTYPGDHVRTAKDTRHFRMICYELQILVRDHVVHGNGHKVRYQYCHVDLQPF